METGVIIKMVEDLFCHLCFIIDAIISDDDRTMQAVIKHISRGEREQVIE